MNLETSKRTNSIRMTAGDIDRRKEPASTRHYKNQKIRNASKTASSQYQFKDRCLTLSHQPSN